MDGYALEACLATRERPRFQIDISSNPAPSCGTPPFDAGHARLPLWAWPWTDWPIFDRSVFERDLQRVERWYRARGFYDAHVEASAIVPPPGIDVEENDRLDITIDVEEGEPVLVTSTSFEGIEPLPRALRESVVASLDLGEGDRFDEALYDAAKTAIIRALREGSYAKARVEGRVTIDRAAKTAEIVFVVTPGPSCRFGTLTIYVDSEEIPGLPIAAASQLEEGRPYSQEALDSAQRAVYALGTFSSVEVVADLEGDGEVIDVELRARTGPLTRFGLGLGVQLGQVVGNAALEAAPVAQSDVHLLGFYEDKNFLGDLQRLRIELRPRVVFRNALPFTTDPNLGAILSVDFKRPAFLEARTSLLAGVRFDVGPDVFGRTFNRFLVDAWTGPERTFDRGRIYLSGAVHGLVFAPFRLDWITPHDDGPAIPDDQHFFGIGFLEQTLRADYRNDPTHPREGVFFQLGLQESFVGSWYYLRAIPEARVYAPLPLGLVFAARFSVGFLHIFHTDQPTTNSDGTLGPGALGPDVYRLRGGGATSNRGFLPGRLGGRQGATPDLDESGLIGGVRRWEASLELRIPLTESLGIVLFGDAGDVNPLPHFRFYALQLSVGGGIRFSTPVGPLRLDVGFRVPGAQVLGSNPDRPPAAPAQDFLGAKLEGAIHLTVGEAF